MRRTASAPTWPPSRVAPTSPVRLFTAAVLVAVAITTTVGRAGAEQPAISPSAPAEIASR